MTDLELFKFYTSQVNDKISDLFQTMPQSNILGPIYPALQEIVDLFNQPASNIKDEQITNLQSSIKNFSEQHSLELSPAQKAWLCDIRISCDDVRVFVHKLNDHGPQ